MNSICLACLIYTLEDKPVEDNMYLSIFFVWLSKVIQSGGLTSNDMIHIHVDSRTMAYFQNTSMVFPCLIQRIPCPYMIYVITPPKTPLEGMMNKYNFTEYTQDIYIYCDIDILISNPFSIMTQHMVPDMVYVCPEGPLKNHLYSAGFPDDFLISDTMAGFSAGKFAITGKALRDTLFTRIRQVCDYSSTHYTVEQPFFNRAVYGIDAVDYGLLFSFVSFNGQDFDVSTTVFHDLAGNPGNGSEHMNRMIGTLCLYLSGYYSRPVK